MSFFQLSEKQKFLLYFRSNNDAALVRGKKNEKKPLLEENCYWRRTKKAQPKGIETPSHSNFSNKKY